MRLIFIYGPPAAGKLTVARELSRLTGLSVFHNHLTIELAREVMPEPNPLRGELVANLRLAVFEAAAKSDVSTLFTYVYAHGSDDPFVQRILDIVEGYGGEVCFVQLIAPPEILKDRIGHESRQPFSKIKRLSTLEDVMAKNDLYSPVPMRPSLTLDSALQSPEQAARRIAEHFGLALSS